ncbi:MAG: L,D-transpeptidase family protein [Chitinophagaceae bacterium]|nr:L,D-transpeptidase family protein [Chitinophagaceae bacterium]
MKFVLFSICSIFFSSCTLADKNSSPFPVFIDSICVKKSERKMYVFSSKKLIKTYTISIGQNPIGAKKIKGDMKTPEGLYFINDKNPNSSYYKNLGVSYPNELDKKNAAVLKKSTGGDIKIHGFVDVNGNSKNRNTIYSYTYGCICVCNDDMDELFENVKIGAPILIVP